MKRDVEARQSYNTIISNTLSKEEKRSRKRLKFLRRKKKKKKKVKFDSIIDHISVNEKATLLIHATFKEPSPAEKRLEKAKHILYASHFVAKFSELGWQFCLVLFLTSLTEYKSLVLVSTYGLFTGLVVCFAGPSAGALVDSKHYNRLAIAKFFIWIQNLSVIVATFCCFFLLRMVPFANKLENEKIHQSEVLPDLAPPATYTTWILLVAIHIFGAFGSLTDQSMTVAMERDWIVVMSKVASGSGDRDEESESEEDSSKIFSSQGSYESDVSSLSVGNASFGPNTTLNNEIISKLKEKTWLSQTNTVMKQIDLICRLAAPAAAGIYFGFFDNYKAGDTIQDSHWYYLSYAALIIGILNLISLCVENLCMKLIYYYVPLLADKGTNIDKTNNINKDEKIFTIPQESEEDQTSEDDKEGSNVFSGEFKRGLKRLSTIHSGRGKSSWSLWSNDEEDKDEIRCNILTVPRGIRLYWQQPISFGGFALSLLYLNVLSFGALMTAYLVWRGMSYEKIGILRGLSSIVGLMGTVGYHFSSRKYKLPFTGIWSIVLQFTCLSLCFISLFVPNDALSLSILIFGVIASRIGLYVFDLTITQLMQEMIPEDIRGIIGGVQKSLNGFFELTTYGLGLFFADPSNFSLLVATGYVSVGVAMCLYLWGINYYKDIIQVYL